MFKSRIALMLALLCAFTSQSAQAFFDPPYITPAAPVAGDTVSVNIREGQCDGILSATGYPQITREGNAIRILFWGVRYFNPELCTLPIGTETDPIGLFPPGSYTLQVDLTYFGPTGILVTDTIGTASFAVGGGTAPAVSAPVNGLAALLLLVLVLVGLAAWRLRVRGATCLLIVFTAASFDVRAQTPPDNPVVEVLLTTAPGAPTADQVVSYYNRTPRTGTIAWTLPVGRTPSAFSQSNHNARRV